LPEDDKTIEEVAFLTVCVKIEEVLALWLLSPPYTAVTGCVPTASARALYVVFPLLMVPVPSVVLPSMKVTVPVTFVGDMAAVNLTEAP
jgi:hypothetical protein